MSLESYMKENGLQALYKYLKSRLDKRDADILKKIPDEVTIINRDELKDEIKQEILDTLPENPGSGTEVTRVDDDDIDSLFDD